MKAYGGYPARAAEDASRRTRSCVAEVTAPGYVRAMIRYQLTVPGRAARPGDERNEVVHVSLDADYADQRAPLRVDASPAAQEKVLRAISSATGVRGRPIEDVTTPQDLDCALRSVILRYLEPKLIEGTDVFERRKPPSDPPDVIEADMAALVANFVVMAFPTWDVNDTYHSDRVIRSLHELMRHIQGWIGRQHDRDAALDSLGAKIVGSIDAVVRDFGDRLAAPQLALKDLDQANASRLARIFVDRLESSNDADLEDAAIALCDRVAELHRLSTP